MAEKDNMVEDRPLLTVVIPVRNRFEHVKSSIRSVLRVSSPRLQLAVEDNSDSNQLELWLKENIADRRLTYHYSNEQSSMSANFDRAMGLVTGEYVCFIGDDDGVNPEIIDAAQWAQENALDALVPTNLINYIWPDLHMTTRGALEGGEIMIRPFSAEKTFPDPESEMLKCAMDAGQNFHKLPKVYYGLVRKHCMDLVKERAGTYFPGISPDLSGALAVANYAKHICHIDYPLFVPGSSLGSNAGQSGLKKLIGRLADQAWLPKTCEQDWSEIVPMFYSAQTVWAEAAVSALRTMGREDVLRKFNVPKLYTYCFIFYYRYMNSTGNSYFRAIRSLGRGTFVGTFQFMYWFCYWWGLRAKSLFHRVTGRSYKEDSYRQKGLQNIDEAVQAVSEYLAKSGFQFSKIVL